MTVLRYLPREVDPLVYNMSHEDPGDVKYSSIGGLAEQIRELREVSVVQYLWVHLSFLFIRYTGKVAFWAFRLPRVVVPLRLQLCAFHCFTVFSVNMA